MCQWKCHNKQKKVCEQRASNFIQWRPMNETIRLTLMKEICENVAAVHVRSSLGIVFFYDLIMWWLKEKKFKVELASFVDRASRRLAQPQIWLAVVTSIFLQFWRNLGKLASQKKQNSKDREKISQTERNVINWQQMSEDEAYFKSRLRVAIPPSAFVGGRSATGREVAGYWPGSGRSRWQCCLATALFESVSVWEAKWKPLAAAARNATKSQIDDSAHCSLSFFDNKRLGSEWENQKKSHLAFMSRHHARLSAPPMT